MPPAKRLRKPPPPTPLAIGTQLAGYEVRSVLGIGAFGIVYRVVDPATEVELAVKEYLPTALAVRADGAAVLPRSSAEAETFANGLRFFVNEGKLLQQVNHPTLVKVHGLWEANGTAYLAMDLYTGRNLQDTMSTRWRSPREPALRSMLDALLAPLEALHQAGLQHRDVSPQTIMVELDGRLVLMDLGAARRVTSALGETGPTGPRDGYAPIELYGKGEGHAKGAWTDLYALGATLHYLMAGKAPPVATERAAAGAAADRPAFKLYRDDGRYSLEFLAILDWMLAVKPGDRPQSVAELRKALAGEGVPRHLVPTRRQRLKLRLRRYEMLMWIAVWLLAAAVLALGVRWTLSLPIVKDWLLRFQ